MYRGRVAIVHLLSPGLNRSQKFPSGLENPKYTLERLTKLQPLLIIFQSHALCSFPGCRRSDSEDKVYFRLRFLFLSPYKPVKKEGTPRFNTILTENPINSRPLGIRSAGCQRDSLGNKLLSGSTSFITTRRESKPGRVEEDGAS